MKKFFTKHAALIVIVCLAFSLRMYKITNPVLDWHSFRQADTASVTREYLKHGIDLLHPKYQDLSNIQSGEDNLEGYRMVELPVLNALVAGLVKTFPFMGLEITHRVVSVLFSLGALIFLFLVTKEFSGVRVAYATALVFAVLPYSIYYSRAILPEPALLLFFTGSLYCFIEWVKSKKIWWYLFSLLALAMSVLLKPFVLFFFPLFIVIAYTSKNKKVFKNYLLYVFFIISVIPFMWWRQWIAQFPSGIPANHWLFDGINTPFPDWLPKNPVTVLLHKFFGYNIEGLRYHPAWVRWLVFERLTKLILGFAGVLFMISALYNLKKKELYILGTWWICTLFYFVIIAKGNVQHDYYQMIIMPLIAWTMGRGLIMLEILLSKKLTRVIAFSIVVVVFLTSILLSWRQVRGFYMINHPEYVIAGDAANRLTPANAKIIAPAVGDTMFLYQTNRTGWPIGYHIEEKISNGATFYISTSYDEEARMLEKEYFTVEKTPNHILIDLTRKNSDSI